MEQEMNSYGHAFIYEKDKNGEWWEVNNGRKEKVDYERDILPHIMFGCATLGYKTPKKTDLSFADLKSQAPDLLNSPAFLSFDTTKAPDIQKSGDKLDSYVKFNAGLKKYNQ
jgi:hypothetical protein